MDGSFTVDGSFELVFDSLGNSPLSSWKQIFSNIKGIFSYFIIKDVLIRIASSRRF